MDVARTACASIALIATLALGCSQSSPPAGSAAAAQPQPPEAVVHQFLEAVRVGDHHQASELLTPLAQQKFSETDLVVAPPGSDTAQFRILGVDYVDGIAQVATEWTDLEDGRPQTDRLVWILRPQEQGWRIAGMSAIVFADGDPVLLNFEDPTDMQRKQQLAEEELLRREREKQAARLPGR